MGFGHRVYKAYDPRARALAPLASYQSKRNKDARELYKTKTVSGSELDQRAAERDADRAALRAAKGALSDTVIQAPFDGRVGLRRASIGSLATPDLVITTLDDTDTIKLDFDVPETALGLLEAGLAIEAQSAAWPDEVFEGRVSVVDTRVDPISRTITVRARIPNADGRLRPGMFLAVTLLRRDVQALMIPEQAIVPEQSKQFVLVVGDDLLVEKREVRTGRRRPGQVEVLSGLAAGEQVIAEGTQKARPGERTRIVGRISLPQLGSGFVRDGLAQPGPAPPRPAPPLPQSGTP
jgi:membrane fusion protein (multidrug efflux system)